MPAAFSTDANRIFPHGKETDAVFPAQCLSRAGPGLSGKPPVREHPPLPGPNTFHEEE